MLVFSTPPPPPFELLPLCLLSDLPHFSPLPKVDVQYIQRVSGCGGVLSCVIDYNLHCLTLTRFRTYKIATSPQKTKIPVKTIFRDLCLYSSFVHGRRSHFYTLQQQKMQYSELYKVCPKEDQKSWEKTSHRERFQRWGERHLYAVQSHKKLRTWGCMWPSRPWKNYVPNGWPRCSPSSPIEEGCERNRKGRLYFKLYKASVSSSLRSIHIMRCVHQGLREMGRTL